MANKNSSSTVSKSLVNNIKKKANEAIKEERNNTYKKQAERTMQNTQVSDEKRTNTFNRTRQSMALNPNRKLSESDSAYTKKTANDYFANNEKAKKAFQMQSSNPTMARRYREENMTQAERDEYDRMSALKTKTNDASAFVSGGFSKLPGSNQILKAYDKAFDKKGDTSAVNTKKNLKTQSPLAYTGGELYQTMVNYGIANDLLSGVGAFDKAGNKLAGVTDATEYGSKALNRGKALAGLMRGQTADTILDVLPKLADDIQEGKSASEVAKNFGKNELINLGFNLVPESLAYLGRGLKSKNALKNLKEIQNSDINLSDLAKSDIPSLMTPAYRQEVDDVVSEIDPEMMSKEGLEALDYIVNGSKRYSPDEFIENFSRDADLGEMIDYTPTESYLKSFAEGQEMERLAKDQARPFDYMDDLNSVINSDAPVDTSLYSEYDPIQQLARNKAVQSNMRAFDSQVPSLERRGLNSFLNQSGQQSEALAPTKDALENLYKNGLISKEDYLKRLENIIGGTRNYASVPMMSNKTLDSVSDEAKSLSDLIDDGVLAKKSVGRRNVNNALDEASRVISDATDSAKGIDPSGLRPESDLDRFYRQIEEAEAVAREEERRAARTVATKEGVPDDDLIGQQYETLKNSEMFKSAEAQAQLETMKKNGVFDKVGGVEKRVASMEEAARQFAENPDKVRNEILTSGDFVSGLDVDKSALCIKDALDKGDNAMLNRLTRVYTMRTSSAGRTLRAIQDNYIPTEAGTLSEGVRYMMKQADRFLKTGGNAAREVERMAESVVANHNVAELVAKGMDEVNVKAISDALDMGADAEEITKMIAMYEKCGTTQISDATIQQIKDIYKQIEDGGFGINSKERAELEAQAYSVLANEIGGTRSLKQKWDSWRYLAMLGNTRTHIRNVFGNTMQYMVTEIKDNIGGLIESVADAVTPGGINRTKAILNRLDESDNALISLARSDADNEAYKMLNDAGHKYNDVTGMVEQNLDAFDNKFLNYINNKNSNLLEAEDYFGLKNKYSKSLARFLKANGADESIFKATDEQSQALLNQAREYASNQAKQATFHEYSVMADKLSQMSQEWRYGEKANAFSKVGGAALESLVPFKKTPINVLKQGIKYSPVSIAQGIFDGMTKLKSGKATASQVIEELSAGMTGTGIMLLGAFMAKQGLLNGKGDEDYNVKAAETKQGKQEYAIQIGNKSYTIDWLAPFSLPLFVGAELSKLNENVDDDSDWIDKLTTAISTIGEPITEMSMLQGINDALEQVSYSKESALGTLLGNTATGYVTQGVPTLLGQVARSVDPTRRSTYSDKEAGLKKQVERSMLKTMNKIPGLSDKNEEYRNMWGETEENTGGNVLGRLAYNMLSPGYYADGSDTSAVDKELNRLYQETGTSAYSDVSSGKVGDVRLSREDFTKYQTMYGQNNKALATSIMQNPNYQELDDTDKVEVIKKAYTMSKNIANYEVGGKDIPKNSAKLYEIYKSSGIDGLAETLIANKQKVNDENTIKAEALALGFTTESGEGSISEYKKAVAATGSADPESITEYANVQNKIKSYETGTDIDGKPKYLAVNDTTKKIYNDFGDEGLSAYASLKKAKLTKDPDIVEALNNTNLSAEGKAYIFLKIKGGSLAKVPSLMNDVEDQYNWYYIKSLIDDDKNGRLKNSEKANLIPTLRANNFDEDYINRVVNEGWFK